MVFATQVLALGIFEAIGNRAIESNVEAIASKEGVEMGVDFAPYDGQDELSVSSALHLSLESVR